jgi:hypothetical protein
MPKCRPLLRLVCRALLTASVVFSPFHAPYAHASSPLVIGEIAWAGSSVSLADEWIEIWNLGDQDASLAGYSLVGASAEPMTLPDDAVIPAHGAYLISNYAADDLKSALDAPPQFVTTAVSLSNSALSIALIDPSGVEIDRAGDGTAPPAGTSGTVKATMLRNGDVWTTATESIGFDAGVNDLGTPGVCDGCAAVAEDPPPIVEEPPADAVTTTTEPTIPETDVASSTEPLPDTSETSSTDAIPVEIQMDPTVTSTEDLIETVTPTTTEAVTTDIPPRYDLLRLNEIMPQPDGESEWVEITSVDPSIPVPLAGIQLHDATGKIFTFATGTIDATTPFVRAVLSSSRLNNGGDAVSVRNPDSVTIDTLTYEGSETGHPWAREDDGTGPWRITLTSTPDSTNIITEPETVTNDIVTEATTNTQQSIATTPIVPVTATVSLPDTISTPATSQTNQSTPIAPTTAVTKQPATKQPTVAKAVTAKTVSTKSAMTASTTKKTTAPKTTAKTAVKKKTSTSTAAKTTASIPITIAMTSSDTYRGIRVTLRGSVGSPSGLLSSHGFVLLAPDGRGLLVRVPASMKLPVLGDAVQVTGTLQFDDLDIPSLKLGAKDGWTVLADGSLKAAPRTTDLLAPGNEDRWSLVSATGTVKRVQGTNITVDFDDAEITVTIRKAVDYRASRLATGDTIRVTGLLDASTAVPRILPRTADEIALIAHAAPALAAAPKTALPGWTPFGAAGLAIAGTEGVKHYREHRKRRTLEKMLETPSNANDV